MRPASLSVRLALGYAATLMLLLGAFAVFSYVATQQAALRSFDRHLEHEWHSLAPLVRPGPDVTTLATAPPAAIRTGGAASTYLRVADARGRVVYESPNLAGRAPLPALRARAGDDRIRPFTWDGTQVRSLTVPVPGGGWAEVTGEVWARASEARELAGILALGVLFGLLVALGAGWTLARRALRPVAVLTEAAGAMARDARPGARLPAQFTPRDELTRLAETFNALLQRLEAARARERRFTADAAHELLTPLATIRSDAEVALRREREPEAYRAVLGRVVADVAAMAATVRGMLDLARAEAERSGEPEPIDLGELVAQRVERFRPLALAREVVLDVDTAEGVRVAGEGAALAEVVDNLVSNALKYTPGGGQVAIRLGHDHGREDCSGAATLTVADTGVGFSAAERERLFERFFRAEVPEVQMQPGSGLGLSIAHVIVEGLGGTLEAMSDGPGRGATFRVTLPCLGGTTTRTQARERWPSARSAGVA